MLANVFMKTNADRATAFLIAAGTIGLFLLAGMAVYADIDASFYQGMPEVWLQLMGIPADADAAALAFGAIYGTIGSLTLAGVAIAMGSASIAGEERDGTLGLLLGNPVSRSRVLAAKAASLLALTTLGTLIIWGMGYATPAILAVEVGALDVDALTFHLFVNTLFYGFLALVVGAWTGRGGVATGVSAGVMVVGWLGVGLLPLIERLEGWEQVLPWYYFDGSQPSVNGVDWGHAALLGGASIALLALGFIGVNRRDLRGRGLGTTFTDRLRDNRLVGSVVERLAGSVRVSSLAAKTASDFQGLTLVLAGIMALMAVMMGPIYAVIPTETWDAFGQFPEVLIAMIGGGDFSTPEGFIQAEVFSITAPIVLGILTIVMGARALAGEEQDHTMGLLLASPLGRSRIVLTKAMVMVLLTSVIGLATFVGTWGGVVLGDVDLSIGGLAATSVLVTLLALGFGGVALLLSALFGRTSIASYGATAFALVGYFVWAFLSINENTEGWSRLSPFHHYLGSDPLANGMTWGGAAVLLAVFALGVALAVPAFQRRDLRG
ncbi:MAG: ABC transporter permease subunit [Acidimicrobiia bacterium]